MKKKGFTLVELLAVIAILAILVIIALPNIMELFNTSKLNSFNNEVKEIYKTAQTQWMSEALSGGGEKNYSNGENCPADMKLKLSGRELQYAVTINSSGKITFLSVTDGTYLYDTANNGDILENIDDISSAELLLSGVTGDVTCLFDEDDEFQSFRVDD